MTKLYKLVKELDALEKKELYVNYDHYFHAPTINRRGLHITPVDALILRTVNNNPVGTPIELVLEDLS